MTVKKKGTESHRLKEGIDFGPIKWSEKIRKEIEK